MSQETVKTYTEFKLPPEVVSRTDVSRLVGELERIDGAMTAASIRAQGGAPTDMPTASSAAAAFLTLNELTFNDSRVRSAIISEARHLKDKAPVIHMTFATTADGESLARLVQWLRSSLHPQAVITVGLQPALMAGVYVRTPNHVHDLSLKGRLRGQHGALVKQLEAL